MAWTVPDITAALRVPHRPEAVVLAALRYAETRVAEVMGPEQIGQTVAFTWRLYGDAREDLQLPHHARIQSVSMRGSVVDADDWYLTQAYLLRRPYGRWGGEVVASGVLDRDDARRSAVELAITQVILERSTLFSSSVAGVFQQYGDQDANIDRILNSAYPGHLAAIRRLPDEIVYGSADTDRVYIGVKAAPALTGLALHGEGIGADQLLTLPEYAGAMYVWYAQPSSFAPLMSLSFSREAVFSQLAYFDRHAAAVQNRDEIDYDVYVSQDAILVSGSPLTVAR